MSALTPESLLEAVEQGLSDAQIGARLGASSRTVLRWRQRLGLASTWVAHVPDHGTVQRYKGTANVKPCRCTRCRRANAQMAQRYRSDAQRRTALATRWATPWTPEDDAVLLDPSLGTLVDRAALLGRTYVAAHLRLHRLREASRPN